MKIVVVAGWTEYVAFVLVLVVLPDSALLLVLALVSAPRGPCPCAVLGTGSNPSIEGTVGLPTTPSPSPNDCDDNVDDDVHQLVCQRVGSCV